MCCHIHSPSHQLVVWTAVVVVVAAKVDAVVVVVVVFVVVVVIAVSAILTQKKTLNPFLKIFGKYQRLVTLTQFRVDGRVPDEPHRGGEAKLGAGVQVGDSAHLVNLF